MHTAIQRLLLAQMSAACCEADVCLLHIVHPPCLQVGQQCYGAQLTHVFRQVTKRVSATSFEENMHGYAPLEKLPHVLRQVSNVMSATQCQPDRVSKTISATAYGVYNRAVHHCTQFTHVFRQVDNIIHKNSSSMIWSIMICSSKFSSITLNTLKCLRFSLHEFQTFLKSEFSVIQADREFVDILASIRAGRCSPEGSTVQQLQGRCGQPLDTSDGILPTKVSSSSCSSSSSDCCSSSSAH